MAESGSVFASVEQAVAEIRAGRMVIVVDDEGPGRMRGI